MHGLRTYDIERFIWDQPLLQLIQLVICQPLQKVGLVSPGLAPSKTSSLLAQEVGTKEHAPQQAPDCKKSGPTACHSDPAERHSDVTGQPRDVPQHSASADKVKSQQGEQALLRIPAFFRVNMFMLLEKEEISSGGHAVPISAAAVTRLQERLRARPNAKASTEAERMKSNEQAKKPQEGSAGSASPAGAPGTPRARGAKLGSSGAQHPVEQSARSAASRGAPETSRARGAKLRSSGDRGETKVFYTTPPDTNDWMYRRELFKKLDQKYGPFSLDAAASASGDNAHCKKYCSEEDSFGEDSQRREGLGQFPFQRCATLRQPLFGGEEGRSEPFRHLHPA